MARARKAQQAWAVLPMEERAQRLLRLRDALADRADDLVDIMVLECGKPRHEALIHEVTTLLDLVGWAAPRARGGPRSREQEAAPDEAPHRRGTSRSARRHRSNLALEFPLVIPMGTVIEALVTGNAAS